MSGQRGQILLESGTNEVEFLQFSVAGHLFGINVAKVSQAIRFKDVQITKLPNVGKEYLGSVFFRGEHVSVIDLRTYLGVDGPPPSVDTRILLVAEFNKKFFGYVIDTIDGIQRVTWKEFEPINGLVFGERQRAVVGTVTVGNNVVMILDFEDLMANVDPSIKPDRFANEIRPADEGFDRSLVQIVYAEDSALIRKLVQRTLTNAGYSNLKCFDNGSLALDYLMKDEKVKVDLVLSDIEMPQMDGLTFCKNLKESSRFAEVPVVFFSSLINDQMKSKCKSVGGAASFSKPEIHNVVSSLDELLKAK